MAHAAQRGIAEVREFRKAHGDAYYFNWKLHIPEEFQHPFVPDHQAMRTLQLHAGQVPHLLAADLRRAFSGVVAGNVKLQGIQAIEKHGLFEIHGEAAIMEQLDQLLSAFAEQGRMKLLGMVYRPCYRVVRSFSSEIN